MYSIVGALIFAPVIGLFSHESFSIASDSGWPFAWNYQFGSAVSGISRHPCVLVASRLVGEDDAGFTVDTSIQSTGTVTFG